MKNKRTLKRIYMGLGVLFSIIGGIIAIIAATAWHIDQSVTWQVLVFAIMNFLVAYGFFTRSTWLLYAFFAALIGLVILVGLFSVHFGMGSLGISSAIKIAVIGIILWFIYKTRMHLRSEPNDIYIGGLFIVLLLGTMSTTALLALS